MARPLWERRLVHAIADHLRRQGVGTDAAAYILAAFVVRDLDRRYGLAAEMAKYSFEDLFGPDDPEQTSPKYLRALDRFWGSVSVPDPKAERNKLLLLATASALRGGSAEARAAAELAREAPLDEPILGKLAGEWIARRPWEGLGSSLGGLRDEMALTGDAAVLAAFDRLAAAERDRAAVVKTFQRWAKGLEWYDGRIDGVWGPKSEAAFLRAVPMAAGRLSELRDVVPLRGVFADAPTATSADARAIALLITRDVWLGGNPDRLAAEAAPAPEGGAGITVSYPKAEAATSTPTPGGGSQVVVSYPKAEGGRERVTISLPPAGEDAAGAPAAGWRPSRDLLIGGGLVAGGLLIVGAAWWLRQRRQPLPDEGG